MDRERIARRYAPDKPAREEDCYWWNHKGKYCELGPGNRPNLSIDATTVLLQYRFPVSDIASRNTEEGWDTDEQHADRISQGL